MTVTQVVERERPFQDSTSAIEMVSKFHLQKVPLRKAGSRLFDFKNDADKAAQLRRAEKKRKREAMLIQNEYNQKVRMLRKYREGERPDFGGLCRIYLIHSET